MLVLLNALTFRFKSPEVERLDLAVASCSTVLIPVTTALIPMLKEGVAAKVHPCPHKTEPSHDFLPLEMRKGNWSAAKAKPHIVKSLTQKEVEVGWVQPTHTGGQTNQPSPHTPGNRCGQAQSNRSCMDGALPRRG